MSEDDRDEGRKVGLMVVFSSVAVLLAGVIGFAVVRSLKAPAVPVAQSAAAAASGVDVADVLVDLTPTGPALAVVYFESASAALTPEADPGLAETIKALAAEPTRRVLLSGYHDSTGDPAMNAELAKQRAKAVRAALVVAGVPLNQVMLRKPESTTGTGTGREARRVEIRIVDAQ
ncbi:OmpA family protein [Sphaerotilus sp.]|uniref:OmpA family protein n=1 Tax=Sphaerotilus sp. TaxID=2093942 RepID=UPI00286E934A|nr:OmpA family protein [Sphaerotilus sp.]